MVQFRELDDRVSFAPPACRVRRADGLHEHLPRRSRGGKRLHGSVEGRWGIHEEAAGIRVYPAPSWDRWQHDVHQRRGVGFGSSFPSGGEPTGVSGQPVALSGQLSGVASHLYEGRCSWDLRRLTSPLSESKTAHRPSRTSGDYLALRSAGVVYVVASRYRGRSAAGRPPACSNHRRRWRRLRSGPLLTPCMEGSGAGKSGKTVVIAAIRCWPALARRPAAARAPTTGALI